MSLRCSAAVVFFVLGVLTGPLFLQLVVVDGGSWSPSILAFWKNWTQPSYLQRIDPSAILATLADQGGLFVPDYIDDDIHVMRKALHCQQAELHLWGRRLALTNFTIGLPSSKDDDEKEYHKRRPLLRVGRIEVHWDSYTAAHPVLDIGVDEVEVSVEFTNVLLTRNNWNELEDIGFPPLFVPKEQPEEGALAVAQNVKETSTDEEPSSSTATSSSSWIRFASLQAAGNVTLRLRSRPLQRDLGVVTLDLAALQEISDQIQQQSQRNLETTGQAGLTVSELLDLLQSFFVTKVQQHLLDTDWPALMAEYEQHAFLDNPRDLVRTGLQRMDQWLGQAGSAALQYGMDAAEHAMQESMSSSSSSSSSKWAQKMQSWLGTMQELEHELAAAAAAAAEAKHDKEEP